MWKKFLIAFLSLAFLIELIFTVCAFFAPSWFVTQFKLKVTDDTLFLCHVTAWFLLFLTTICGLAIQWVKKGLVQGWQLSQILGLWWVGIGLGLFFLFGRVDNLFLDTLKGALIFISALKSRRTS